MPTAAVILPVYNAGHTIKDALSSVLEQTFKDIQVIVVNDASTDNSKEILESFEDPRIFLLNNSSNKGIEYSLNKAVAAADCKYLVRMDGDDICMPERIAEQVACLKASPSVAVLGSWAEFFYPNGSSQLCCMPVGNDGIKARLLFQSALIHPSVVIRREIFEKVSYSSKYPAAEDYDLWTKLACNKSVRFDNLPKALLRYRVHEGSISKSHKKTQTDSSNLIRTMLLKRLGFSATPEEIALHNNLAKNTYSLPLQREVKDELERWLQKIMQYNKEKNYCERASFELEVCRRFMGLAYIIDAKQPQLAAEILNSKIIPGDVLEAALSAPI